MNIIGKIVMHKTFGIGAVKEQNDTLIKIDFNGEIKQFLYPLAFEKFLTAKDVDVQSAILREIAEVQSQNVEQKQKKVKADYKPPASVSRPLHHNPQWREKKSLRKNVAFKCTYCDGGKTSQRIGFAGVCSDTVMRYNVLERRRVWCSDFECACNKHLDGKISRSKIEWPCYESRMLLDWRADAGVYQSGGKRGQPIAMKEVRANCLCVLTSRSPNASEAERFIFGVFLIDEAYEGDHQETGYVSTSSEFKIELTNKESQSLLFWRYYANSNSSSHPMWGTGLFRYISADISAQILRDVAKVKKGTKEETLANRFLEHFCMTNGVEKNELPEPYGALMR